ncbi:MAG: hypothetical protein KGL95_14735 [Patescibacteria group bacterium]|nr:hypothetical protein [Patescibacteria group bacterium]
MKIKILLTDNNGTTYEGEIELQKQPLKNLQEKSLSIQKHWYRTGSTTEKLSNLIEDGFFDENRTIKDIITKLKSQDYHFEPKDLTLPLRTIVRKGHLKRTKELQNGIKSKKWTYLATYVDVKTGRNK